ncbi:MAG: pseudouridine synthase [Bacteroidota bacterium]
MKHQYFLLYKPYGYLSQFTKEMPEHRTLGDLYAFPKAVYPVGRLDRDSEGLLLLTDDKKLTERLLNPKFRHPRTYYVQVEGVPSEAALEQLRLGVDIRIKKKTYRTRPAQVQVFETPPQVPERQPPIRFRANIPTTWLCLSLTEGKNRQVRRMCAKVGFPVLRLLRWSIGKVALGNMKVGEVKMLEREELYELLDVL